MTQEIMSEEQKLTEALSILQGTLNSTSITRVDRLKVALCGDKKTGKSNVIARTCRKPLLEYDFDDRRESIAGIEGVIIKTLVDKDSGQPSAWGKLETDLGSLEYMKSQGKLPFKSIALDSMTYLRQYAENQMMKDTPNLRKATIGSRNYFIAQGWDSINYTQRMLSELLRRFFDLEIDIYCVFHTQPEKDRVRSTKENTVYTDKITIEPQNLNILLAMFNEVWRTYIDMDGNFKLQVKPDYFFNASTALSVDAIEDQNIAKILEKHDKTKV